jgi:hypothetical protein
LDEFERQEPERNPRHRAQHPTGFEPGLTYNPSIGGSLVYASDGPNDDPAIWEQLIKDFGLDPALTKIVPGSVQIRAWDAAIGNGEVRRMLYYRAQLTPRGGNPERVDVDDLIAEVAKWKPVKFKSVDTDRALVICLSDWQLGKNEPDENGPASTVGRILRALERAVLHLKAMAKTNRPVKTLYLVGLGDLVEQCSGFYPMQTATVCLDRRQQMRLGRRLLLKYVDTLLPHVEKIVLAAVPGNHGENRNSAGKAYTTWTDNDDLAIFEGVSEVLQANPERYGQVSVPLGAIADNLTLTLDVGGIPVAFAHGHQFTGSGASQAVMEKWWRDQIMGRQAVADAEMLFAGHRHHLVISESTGRTVFQCPSMDSGSYWFTARTGNNSPAGTLAVGIGTDYGTRGWGDFAIL